MKIVGRVIICSLLFCAIDNLSGQEQQSVLLNEGILVIKTEGTSFLGSGITEDDAKTFAINDAKRTALEKAGTYLEAHTEILNYKLVKDEIITFTGGLLKVNILREERALINNMFAFKVEVEATIDTKLLNDRIEKLRNDHELEQQLIAERERTKELEARIEKLQASIETSTRKEVQKIVDDLSASDWYKKGENVTDSNLKIEYYSKAIELDQKYFYAYFDRGSAYFQLRRFEESIYDYGKAIEVMKNPSSALGIQTLSLFYLFRGLAYYKLGKYDESLADYNKAIELYPQYAGAYNSRSGFYYRLGKYQESINDCNKAIDLDPKNSKFYDRRAFSYYHLGRYEDAIRDFNKTIELDPKYSGAYTGLGLVYHKLGRNDESIWNCNKAIELNSEGPDYFYNRGTVYNDLGMKKKAVDDFNRYLELAGNVETDADSVRQVIRDLGYKPLH